MKLASIIEALGLKSYSGTVSLEQEVVGGYVSDLLSDVMGFGKEAQIWITVQNHKNVMAIASLKDMAAVILPKGIEPDKDMLRHAIDEKIPVLGTSEEAFETAGKLYQLLENDRIQENQV